jgi:hypothetical protein
MKAQTESLQCHNLDINSFIVVHMAFFKFKNGPDLLTVACFECFTVDAIFKYL